MKHLEFTPAQLIEQLASLQAAARLLKDNPNELLLHTIHMDMEIISKELNNKEHWTVTMFFNRGESKTEVFYTKEEAQETIRRAVFVNEDCVNFNCYKTDAIQPVIRENRKWEQQEAAIFNESTMAP